MRIAPALLLTALGGILADAVTVSVPGIDLNALGAVLFFVGLLWLAVEVTLGLAANRRHRRRRRAREVSLPPVPRRPTKPYDPVLPPRQRSPRADPEAPTRPRPAIRPSATDETRAEDA